MQTTNPGLQDSSIHSMDLTSIVLIGMSTLMEGVTKNLICWRFPLPMIRREDDVRAVRAAAERATLEIMMAIN
jgi:hypothetical protein